MSYPPPGDQNQPPQYPTNQPPQYPPPGGQQPPGGQPPQGYGYPPAPPSGGFGDGYENHIERPGGVTAASIIAIVLSGLSALASLGVVIAAIVAWDAMIDEFRADPAQFELTTSQINDFDDAKGGVFVFLLIWLAIAVFGVLLGIMTMKGQNWARVTTTVFAAISLVIALLLITSIISAVWLIGSIACIVLLYVGGANDWFRYRAGQRGKR